MLRRTVQCTVPEAACSAQVGSCQTLSDQVSPRRGQGRPKRARRQHMCGDVRYDSQRPACALAHELIVTLKSVSCSALIAPPKRDATTHCPPKRAPGSNLSTSPMRA